MQQKKINHIEQSVSSGSKMTCNGHYTIRKPGKSFLKFPRMMRRLHCHCRRANSTDTTHCFTGRILAGRQYYLQYVSAILASSLHRSESLQAPGISHSPYTYLTGRESVYRPIPIHVNAIHYIGSLLTKNAFCIAYL